MAGWHVRPARLEAAMSRTPDFNPDLLLARVVRHAAAAVPDPVADIGRTLRGDTPLPEEVTETVVDAGVGHAALHYSYRRECDAAV
jgi:hypothetical protein